VIDPNLQGKVVLVTGATSGIGHAIARAFDAQGARIAVHYLSDPPAPPSGVTWEHVTPSESVATDLAASLSDAVAVDVDLGADGAPATLLDRVEDELGPVDVLVNNAAHCETPDSILDATEAGLARHYRINAIAPIALIGELSRRRQGHECCVINISTDSARAFAGQVGYGTSKAALEAATRATAIELGPAQIRVNAVAPGPIQTGWMTEEVAQQVESMIPLGRVGYPEDIADACVFLASHQARFVTGQVLQVAGGHAI
jgi:3-oxoacyl-[acyl-carrier protein] reductase